MSDLPPDPGPEPVLQTYPTAEALALIAAINTLLATIAGARTAGVDAASDAHQSWTGQGELAFVHLASTASTNLTKAKTALEDDVETLLAEIATAQAAQATFDRAHLTWRLQTEARANAVAAQGN